MYLDSGSRQTLIGQTQVEGSLWIDCLLNSPGVRRVGGSCRRRGCMSSLRQEQHLITR